MSYRFAEYVTRRDMYFAFGKYFIPSRCECDQSSYYNMAFNINEDGVIYKISVDCVYCRAYDWFYEMYPENCIDKL